MVPVTASVCIKSREDAFSDSRVDLPWHGHRQLPWVPDLDQFPAGRVKRGEVEVNERFYWP